MSFDYLDISLQLKELELEILRRKVTSVEAAMINNHNLNANQCQKEKEKERVGK